MKEKFEQVKIHLKEKKWVYISGAGLFLAGAAAGLAFGQDGIQKIELLNIKIASPDNTQNIVVLARRGHPGYKIVCNETGESAASITRMAQLHGIDRMMLSKHLRFPEKFPDINGVTYTNLGEM
jgi:hypothetical protein